MDIKKTLRVCAGTFSITAAALFPTALSAQLDLQSSPVPRYHLVQLSIDTKKVAPQDFKAKTEEIRSCLDAKVLGKKIDADFKRNRFVLSARLPKDLRDELKELPLGHATQVFKGEGSAMRVLVLCYVV